MFIQPTYDPILYLNVKRVHPDAVLPSYAKEGDAGLDLVAVSIEWNYDYKFWEYDTGIAVEIPFGYVGLAFPRSSISKKEIFQCNSVGVIDSGYRGTIRFRYREAEWGGEKYKVGDKIGQLVIMPYPSIVVQEVKELASSERGDSGFGSSDTGTNMNDDYPSYPTITYKK